MCRAAHSFGRAGTPGMKFAAAVCFLASPEASYITGQVLGGRAAGRRTSFTKLEASVSATCGLRELRESAEPFRTSGRCSDFGRFIHFVIQD